MADTLSYFFKFSTVLAAQHDPIVGPYLVPGNPANFYNPIDVFNLSVSGVNVTAGFWCLVYTSDDLTAHPALQFAIDEFIQTGHGGKVIVNNLVWPVTLNNLQILSQGRINHYIVAVPETNIIPPPPAPVPPPPKSTLVAVAGPVPAALNMFQWTATALQSDFTDPFWSTSGATITLAADTHFSTGVTDVLTENTSTGTHLLGVAGAGNPQLTNTGTDIPFRMAAIAKTKGRRIVFSFDLFLQSNSAWSVGFDLVGGNVGYDVVAGSATTVSAFAMQNLGDGWWLCTVDFLYAVNGGTWVPQIFLDNGSGTAPRSTSYTGDGSSGVELFWFNALPMHAWDCVTTALTDDFTSLSTIDVNNTKAPGFKWYVNNAWPNALHQNPDLTQGPTLASTLSISSPSVLKIFNSANNQGGYTSEIMSACTNGSNGYIGLAFPAPVVFDGFFNWDGTVAGYNTNWNPWPAFWGESIEMRTNNGLSPSQNYTEVDTVEAGHPPFSDAVDMTVAYHLWGAHAQLDGMGANLHAPMALGTFVRLSSMWINAATNGNGKGMFLSFVNGQFTIFGNFGYDTIANPNWADVDLHHLPVIINTGENVTLNAGGGWPMFIDLVNVYTN